MNVKPFRQPNDYTCGPSAVYMLSQALGKANSFEEISRMCWANPVFGSLPFFVKSALRKMDIGFQTFKARQAADLASRLDGSMVIVLTLIEQWPHWILVYGQEGSEFQVADPSAGLITCSTEEIDKRLAAQNILPKYRIARGLIGSAYQVTCANESLAATILVQRLLNG